MKLCKLQRNGLPVLGIVTDYGVVDITGLGFPSRMNDLISGGEEMLSRLSATAADSPPALMSGSYTYLPPTEPHKIICEGLNFKDHAEETGGAAPKHPVFFSKFGDSLNAHNAPARLPQWLRCFDYEAELVIVIGKYAYNVTPEEAEYCIFGYTCGNDLSARDAQFLSSQWLSGKALPGFAPVGPHIVTRDCFDPNVPHSIVCEVNDKLVQSGSTVDMIFSCTETVSAASKFFPLSPGDLIFTGTPAGVIQGRRPEERVWLKSGDAVKVTIEGIGTLMTPLMSMDNGQCIMDNGQWTMDNV